MFDGKKIFDVCGVVDFSDCVFLFVDSEIVCVVVVMGCLWI